MMVPMTTKSPSKRWCELPTQSVSQLNIFFVNKPSSRTAFFRQTTTTGNLRTGSADMYVGTASVFLFTFAKVAPHRWLLTTVRSDDGTNTPTNPDPLLGYWGDGERVTVAVSRPAVDVESVGRRSLKKPALLVDVGRNVSRKRERRNNVLVSLT